VNGVGHSGMTSVPYPEFRLNNENNAVHLRLNYLPPSLREGVRGRG